ncbi:MAG: ATP synthase F1 subunit gamma [Chlorobi bacterium]|nr:ATP synthase F1 subunit gamma [Chlorobiota bacterium]
MAGLKEIKTRIASVKSTRQITSAMKMVSAAYLRKAQDAILQMRPYAGKLQEILLNLSESLEGSNDNIYAEKREELNRVLIVVVTSNRGLCGAFNTNIIKKSIEIATTKYEKLFRNERVHFLIIGKKAYDFFKTKKEYKLNSEHNSIYENLSFENVEKLADKIMNSFTGKEYDEIILVYNQFKNAAIQIVTEEQFLPVKIEKNNNEVKHNIDYILEPTREFIIKELIPKSLKIQFFKALLDSHAAEHGARMTSMHKATDNATDIIRELNLHYNKARQATITKEILEIVSGAEALKG